MAPRRSHGAVPHTLRGRARTTARATIAAVLVVGGAVAIVAASSPTEAEWTDRVHAAAPVAAGTWTTEPVDQNTCTAWDQQGNLISTCTVTGITFNQWHSGGVTTRGYTIDFDTSAGQAMHINFSVDLTEATQAGDDQSAFTWETAGISASPPFSADGDWSCSDLPTLRGRTNAWQTVSPYFQVVSDRAGEQTVC